MESNDSLDTAMDRGNKVYTLDDGSEITLYTRVCICGSSFKTVDGTRRKCTWCKAAQRIEEGA